MSRLRTTRWHDADRAWRYRRKTGKERGFTLIEILIVVIIIGLIASLIAPNLIGRYERSKEEIAKTQVEMLSSGVLSFKLDVGRYPSTLEELIKSSDTRWRGPYLSKQIIPKDPWDQEYQYKVPGEHGPFDLYSLGPNGKLDDKSAKSW
ncbi:MAG: Type II secretion system protein G precursor [Syntrophus sp. PtaB.Bin138]|uniref:type II secretion system major pseudopilin GspG n=1 Tax=Syntrophus sp. (in: bacteria) TaxID=48412 RepID=UPI0009C87B8D|nr:MAG: Type II secretion system protein G precursor [Syntrophus sp. PtaB.Bin138]